MVDLVGGWSRSKFWEVDETCVQSIGWWLLPIIRAFASTSNGKFIQKMNEQTDLCPATKSTFCFSPFFSEFKWNEYFLLAFDSLVDRWTGHLPNKFWFQFIFVVSVSQAVASIALNHRLANWPKVCQNAAKARLHYFYWFSRRSESDSVTRLRFKWEIRSREKRRAKRRARKNFDVSFRICLLHWQSGRMGCVRMSNDRIREICIQKTLFGLFCWWDS